jgi:hypothetical protein
MIMSADMKQMGAANRKGLATEKGKHARFRLLDIYSVLLVVTFLI